MATGEVFPVQDKLVDELRPWDRNPRTISDERMDALKRGLREDPDMLSARPLIALPDGQVIAGNMRLAAAKALGWKAVPVVVADLPDERAKLWALRDNNEYGEWEHGGVADLLAELKDDGVDLALTGFHPDDVDRLLGAMGPVAPPPAGDEAGQGGDGEGGYQEQYGVIVVCSDEAQQQEVYEALKAEGVGVEVRVVVT